jgi:hypothetical protein
MKIEYRPIGTTGYTVLFDEAAGAVALSEFQPSFRQVNQREPLYLSGNEFRQPLGNVTCSQPLAFNIAYASRDACLASVRTINAAFVNKLNHLKVTQGAEIQYYPNAVVEEYRSKLSGSSADHFLSLTTDNVTATPPAN